VRASTKQASDRCSRGSLALIPTLGGGTVEGMKRVLSLASVFVALSLGVLLVPVSPAHGGDCQDKCASTRKSCDNRCEVTRLTCIGACGLPIAPGYQECTGKCGDDSKECGLKCSVEQKACEVECRLPK
jgi:hypothetical protein